MSEPVGYELSHQQRSIVEGPTPTAVVTFVASVPADLSPDSVRASLTSVVARHEVLRTTLRTPAGTRVPVQTVHEDLPVHWVDAGDVQDALARQLAALDARSGPVLAASLIAGRLVLSAAAVIADVPTLETLTAAVLAGTPDDSDPVQYAEYAAWQQERLAEDAERAGEAWGRLVHDDVTTSVPPLPTAAGGDRSATVPAPDGHSVSTWLAAWVITLARLTGETAVTVGVEFDPRADPELAGAAGPYTRIAPFTVTVPGTGSFAAFSAQVARDYDLALAWLEWAPTAPSPSLLFSVAPRGSVGVRPEFGLELQVDPSGTSAEVVAGRDGGASAHDVARAVASALGGVQGDVVDADVLSAAEIDAVLGAAPQPGEARPVIEDILAVARREPDRVALTDGAITLTYAELVERIDGLAAALIEAGAGPLAPVATYIGRSVDLVVAILAAQRAGTGYLPLDVSQPALRSLKQTEIAGVSVLVTGRDGAPSLDGYAGTSLPVTASGTTDLPAPDLGHLAYVIFTSGSTGTPKGVAVSAASLAQYVAAINHVVGRRDTERAWALVTLPTTDLGNTVIYPALTSGGTLHVVPVEAVDDPAAFAAYVAANPIDVLKITPSHLGALLSDRSAAVLPREVLFVGGESLPWQLIAEVRERGACRVLNHYGPTETTVGALAYLVQDDLGTTGSVPIGHALPGAEALVLDSRRRLVPVGAVGELAIGGSGVARGYWGDDALTAERFVAHPYREGHKVYLTGDLARRATDGVITFLGRRDGQVKIRGFRVERGEIEAALREHPSVRRAAVVVREDVGPGRLLVGYAVCQVKPSPSEDELRLHLAARLPDHMIPTRLVVVDALPLSPNGKLDERALPVPPVHRSRERVAPVGATEQRIAAVFGQVLGVDDVAANDDFFELGGHSLLATRIIVELRSQLGVQIPVYSLFEAPTVQALAELVQGAAAEQGAVDDDELARMIAELDELSDEEAAALLAAGEDSVEDPGRSERL